MKRSLLALGAACIALSGMAGVRDLQPQANSLRFDGIKKSEVSQPHLDRPASGLRKAPAKAPQLEDIITEALGRQQNITLTGTGFFMYYEMSYQGYENQNVASHMIYSSNNEVYIYNLLPNTHFNTYVKGKKEGDKIVIDLPQTIGYLDEFDEFVNVGFFKWDAQPFNGVLTDYWWYDYEKDSVTFNLEEDGVWRADIDDMHLLGLALAKDNWYYDNGALQLSFVDFNEIKTELPETIGMVDDYYWYNAGEYGYPVAWGPDVAETYFQGLSQSDPEAVFVANNVDFDLFHLKIPQNEYVGLIQGYYMWTKCCKFVYDENGEAIDAIMMPDDYEYEIVYDFDTNTFVPADPEVTLVTSAAKDRIWYVDAFENFNLINPKDWSGTPKDPYDLHYFLSMSIIGHDGYRVIIPSVSTEGTLLRPDDLYYVVYLDGEPYTFEPGDYDIKESFEYIPWTIETEHLWTPIEIGLDAMKCGDIFVEGFSTFGIQSVYVHDGVETRSNTITLDMESGEILGTSVDSVADDKKVANVKYYDLSGREVSKPAAGIFVKKVTFEDGTVSTVKAAMH